MWACQCVSCSFWSFYTCVCFYFVFFLSYLLVSCLSRPSCAPSWWCERWCSCDWAQCSGLTADWTGSAVTPESSACGAKTGPNSTSSSSTSSSFSAPSHSDAGPKWVCSSAVCGSKVKTVIHDCISTVGFQINEHMIKVIIQVILMPSYIYLTLFFLGRT